MNDTQKNWKSFQDGVRAYTNTVMNANKDYLYSIVGNLARQKAIEEENRQRELAVKQKKEEDEAKQREADLRLQEERIKGVNLANEQNAYLFEQKKQAEQAKPYLNSFASSYTPSVANREDGKIDVKGVSPGLNSALSAISSAAMLPLFSGTNSGEKVAMENGKALEEEYRPLTPNANGELVIDGNASPQYRFKRQTDENGNTLRVDEPFFENSNTYAGVLNDAIRRANQISNYINGGKGFELTQTPVYDDPNKNYSLPVENDLSNYSPDGIEFSFVKTPEWLAKIQQTQKNMLERQDNTHANQMTRQHDRQSFQKSERIAKQDFKEALKKAGIINEVVESQLIKELKDYYSNNPKATTKEIVLEAYKILRSIKDINEKQAAEAAKNICHKLQGNNQKPQTAQTTQKEKAEPEPQLDPNQYDTIHWTMNQNNNQKKTQ